MTEAGFVERLVQPDAEDVHLLDAHASNIRRLWRSHADARRALEGGPRTAQNERKHAARAPARAERRRIAARQGPPPSAADGRRGRPPDGALRRRGAMA